MEVAVSKKYDYMFHTSDRMFSGIGVVQAKDEAEARKLIKSDIKKRRPDVTIKEIRLGEPILANEFLKDQGQNNG